MTDLSEILRAHSARYPLMMPCDAVKLLYQNEFGGGHIVENEKASLSYLLSEYDSARFRKNAPVSEEIGGGYARLYLHPDQIPYAECVNRVFVLSSRRRDGSRERFEQKLALLRACTDEGMFSFGAEELADYLAAYRAAGYPPVSHSEPYRAAYLPAYRVIDARYVRLMPAVYAMYDLFLRKRNPVICIEGRAASGKTTAAELLAPVIGAQIIHMDDFFLPPELRTDSRYAEDGGNVHYERFHDEVIRGIERGEAFSYRIFDCGVMDYTDVRTVDPARPIIIEGAYSMHPYFGDACDLRIFSDIDPALQRARILARNGEAMLRRFETEWIPLEERYFRTYDIRSACDLILP